MALFGLRRTIGNYPYQLVDVGALSPFFKEIVGSARDQSWKRPQEQSYTPAWHWPGNRPGRPLRFFELIRLGLDFDSHSR